MNCDYLIDLLWYMIEKLIMNNNTLLKVFHNLVYSFVIYCVTKLPVAKYPSIVDIKDIACVVLSFYRHHSFIQHKSYGNENIADLLTFVMFSFLFQIAVLSSWLQPQSYDVLHTTMCKSFPGALLWTGRPSAPGNARSHSCAWTWKLPYSRDQA